MCQQRTRKKGKTQLTSRTLLWGQTLLDLTSFDEITNACNSQQEQNSEGRILSKNFTTSTSQTFLDLTSSTKFSKDRLLKFFYST